MVTSVGLAPQIPVRRDSQVNTGDSMSCTNLSICTSKATVTSRSALGDDQNGVNQVDAQLTRCIRGSMRARTPARANTERTPPQDYDTKTYTGS